ncbi:hypothetical protein HDU93_006173 [Gonapodya sp. JEL0774]|nr:hypothetical protein HDU93_006173 [Gonapodya sp. JEL0774]
MTVHPVPKSRASPAAIAACLTELAEKINVETSPSQLKVRSKDLSYHEPVMPVGIVSIMSEEDVSKALTICNKHGVGVVVFAAGTSLEGQVVPGREACVVLDLSMFDKLIAVHPGDLDCVVEPGINWMELNRELKDHGLFFPPDPGAAATVGGMCGTCASGTLAWRYGTMKENVLSLRVVLPTGEIIRTRSRATKSSAGYDLTRLFVGSEGTLGVITQATLRLKKIPTISAAAKFQFPTLDHAARFSAMLVRLSIPLQRLEVMDEVAVRSVNLAFDQDMVEKSVVLLDFAGTSEADVEGQIREVEALARDKEFGCEDLSITKDPIQAEKLWSVRKRALFAAKSLRAGASHGPNPSKPRIATLTTDVAVPPSRLPDILAVTRQLIVKHGVVAPIVAHAGDGNFHCFLLVDESDEKEIKVSEAFRDEMAEAAIAMEGTCTGEHGVGSGKRHLLVKELGEDAILLMRRLKKAVDPKGIMNPGKVFVDEEGPEPKL